MITLNSLSALGKPQATIRRPGNASLQQLSQTQPAPAQDVFFSGHGDKEKKLHQTQLVFDHQGLRFEPKSKKDEKTFLHKQLDELIASNADLNKPYSPFGKPILHDLAYEGNNELVLKALRHGASVHAKDNQTATALHWAARAGHQNVVETLLDAGANPHRLDIYGNKPVHGAETAGHTDIVEQIEWYRLRKFLSENPGPLGF